MWWVARREGHGAGTWGWPHWLWGALSLAEPQAGVPSIRVGLGWADIPCYGRPQQFALLHSPLLVFLLCLVISGCEKEQKSLQKINK